MFLNLAGNQSADHHIIEELTLADIKRVRGKPSGTEVPYTITGKLRDWTFTRAWKYWMAEAEFGHGLPIEIATRLHEKPYPTQGLFALAPPGTPMIYGQVIRVEGDCGCPHPKERVQHYDAEGRMVFVDPEGKIETQRNLIFKDHPQILRTVGGRRLHDARYTRSVDDIIIETSVIDSYHIDTQLGLNELVKAIHESYR